METESLLPIEMRSNQKAVYYLQKGISLGNAKAAQKLGDMYDKMQNYEEAFRYHKIAAEQGEPRSQNDVGFYYEEGQGVPQNYNEAIKLFEKSAEQGHLCGMHSLAVCYKFGNGTTRDISKAKELFRKAARQGHEDSQKALREMGESW